MIEDIKETLKKGKDEILNKHIPEVTNKMMDVYELGVETGIKIGEANMLAKVINYFNQFVDIEREKIEQMVKAITE